RNIYMEVSASTFDGNIVFGELQYIAGLQIEIIYICRDSCFYKSTDEISICTTCSGCGSITDSKLNTCELRINYIGSRFDEIRCTLPDAGCRSKFKIQNRSIQCGTGHVHQFHSCAKGCNHFF
ncbi:MAG: hypothetical protein J6T80_02240, partial [Paludibacteraceae bacterium]|nr:hypothetical protein [Paludibacteraceae bacterium]